MKRETFDQAFEQISDGLLEDALNVYNKKRSRRQLWMRVAAVAATVAIVLTATLWQGKTPDGEIVSAPGILKVYAFDLVEAGGRDISKLEGVEMKEGIEFPSNIGWGWSMNLYPGLPIKFSVPDEYYGDATISYNITVDNGEFFRKYTMETGFFWWGDAYLGQDFGLENHQTIFWHPMETSSESIITTKDPLAAPPQPEYTYFEGEKAFAKVTVYADDHIVGAALIEIYASKEDKSWYQAKLLGTVCFPQIEGKYQCVTQTHVSEYMENWEQ